MVTTGAPERAALERAGFRIAPKVNDHEGQGTASVTVELENGFLELMYLDPNVPMSPGRERAVEKFRQRTNWRTSGWSPFGIGFRRTSSAPMPFATWSVATEWLPPGTAIEMLTPRDDTKSPSLFISPRELVALEPVNTSDEMFQHPSGAKRITSVRLTTPPRYEPIEALRYVRDAGLVRVGRGEAWVLEVTLDGGRKARKDLRPELPLIIRY